MRVEYVNVHDSFVEIGLEPENMEDQAKLVHIGMGNTELKVAVSCNGKSIRAYIHGRRSHRSRRDTAIKRH